MASATFRACGHRWGRGWLGGLVAILLAATPGAWACLGADGTAPPWGGSGPNAILASKILQANQAAMAKGLQAPPAPPIAGSHPAVIILIENAAAGAPFAYSAASLWSQRLVDIDAYYNEVSVGNLRIVKATESHGAANDGVIGPLTVSGLHSGSDIDWNNSATLAAAAIRAANPYINYASFDADLNGTIEADELHILIYQAGDEKSYSSSATPRAWAHNVWAEPSLTNLTPSTDSDGVSLTSYNYCGSEFNGGSMATMGQMVHELGHDIGLPDLYDADGAGSGGNWAGLGGHCLMAAGSWGGSSGDSPVHINGFLKSWLAWTTLTTVSAPGDLHMSLAAVNGSNAVVKILPAVTANDFFIVENRQQTGFDAGLPGSNGGLAVYHCDSSILNDNNIRRTNSVNQNPSNPGIAIEQANGATDLRTNPNSQGADTDYFRTGNKTVFNGGTTPSSNLKSGAASGVDLNAVSDSGATMTFQIGNPPPGPQAKFNPKTYAVNEGDGSVSITVELNQAPGSGNVFTVDYVTANGTAMAGSDYVAASGTLSFTDSETSKTVLVTLLDEGAIEPSESFTITLSNAVGGSIDAGNAVATITIADNDGDNDGDRISNYDEIHGTLGYVTDPDKFDSDDDGVNDLLEITFGYDPTSNANTPQLGALSVPLFR